MGRTARRHGAILLAAVLLGGCATAAPRPRPPRAAEVPRRCAPADPDRGAWFCVVGQLLYGVASFFTPVNELTMR